MFCGLDLNNLTPKDRQTHYDDHLSALDTLPPPSSGSRPRYQPSHAKGSLTKGFSFIDDSTKDYFWYHSLESEPPPNYTPGLIPLLRKVLLKSVERGATRRAVLCYERVVHIYHEMWDAGWGCGGSAYDTRLFSLLSNPTPPSVNNLKVWIEEAWQSGLDPEGARGLKGKLVGHKKWIGTTAFTYRGIPSQLADFDTPDGNVTPLLDWIKSYFDTQTRDHPTSVHERLRGATPVVISDRMPLILQRPGHSHTIVGYEITRDGGTTLLAFDPSIRMKQIRGVALSSFNSSKQHGDHPDNNKHSTSRPSAESPKKALESRNKRAGPSAGGRGDGSPKRLRAGSIGDVIIIEDPRAVEGPSNYVSEHHNGVMAEEETEKLGGDERTLDPKKVLKLFRVDQKKLA
ncbi:peptidase family C78-domain-containing protein [Russula compacta]|nr:peptidase family C78-domain-containing protein [Russula compacta]